METTPQGVWTASDEEQRIRALLQNASDVVAVIDREGKVVFRVPQGMLGYPEGALLGQPVLDLVHPDDRDDAAGRLAAGLQHAGPAPPFECRVRHADGTWRWIEVRATNLLDDPAVGGIVINATDVTGRKQANAALQGDAWFRALVQNATDVVIVCDARGVPRYATPSLRRILGYGLGELGDEQKGFGTDLVHPDDLPELIAAFEKAREEQGAPAAVEFRVRHLDGTWRVFEAIISHLLHEPTVAGIVINARDVTERKEADTALRSSERRWRALFEHSSDLVNVFGPDGRIVFTSDIEGVLGYSSDLSLDVSRLSELLHPDDREHALDVYARMLVTPGIIGPATARIRHADGSWRWIESIANNLLDDPDVHGVVVHTRDITARKAAEEQLRDETNLVETLNTVGKALAAELDLGNLVRAVTGAATAAMGATVGAFYPAAGPRSGETPLATVCGVVPPGFFTPELVRRTLEGEGPQRAACQLGVPVRSQRGEVLGALLCAHPDPDQFTLRSERILAGIAASAGVALDNAGLYHAAQDEISARKMAEAELAHAATHDPLSGLPNRVLFLDRLAMAMARSSRQLRAVGVILFDLDRFKVVNDSLGHAAGDELLVRVAGRLQQVVRPGDTVARLGGDEFVMVCEDLNGDIDAIGIADRVAEALAAPFALDDAEVAVSASVGISVSRGMGRDPAALMRDADAAMYRAKDRGRNRWELFDEGLRTQAVERLSLETALRRAVEREELRLFYQPIFATTGAVAGVEALLRWDHPELGLTLPEYFIRVAEETGLILPIGDWVLSETCRRLARGDLRYGGQDIPVTINLSARQLSRRDLARTVQRVLAETGAEASQLGLEITESVIMEDVESAIITLQALRRLGIRLWVDDFGTGYSSLAYLRRLPLDGLKIDRSFVAGLGKEAEDSAIVAGIVSLARSLGLLSVAEGVETAEQVAMLRELGCDFGQGYHWSPPVPLEELAARLSQ